MTTCFWRLTAQRLLVERGKLDVLPALTRLVEDPSVDSLGLNPGALHALWTMHALEGILTNSVSSKAAVAALKHPGAAVRRSALQVLPPSLAADSLTDRDAQVRLAAFLALSDVSSGILAIDESLYVRLQHAKKPVPAIVSAISDQPNYGDPWILHAASCAAAANDLSFLEHLATHIPDSQARAKLLKIAARVAEHYGRGNPRDSVGKLLIALQSAEPPVAGSIIEGLARGWPRVRYPKLLDDAGEAAVAKLIPSLPPTSRGALAGLARLWGSIAFEKYGAQWSRVPLGEPSESQGKR